MNALYRPGPMDYIPDFVDRKLGIKPIEYDLPEMEEYLQDTYGITVYQEQVMLLSQKLAGFTKGEADTLRKAMGKKLIDVLNSLKDKFMTGGMANGHPEKVLDKIWKDWEKFAQYAFNKSHATCYAWVSYQTGYLKCHYTAEFLAANLSCNLSNMEEIKKIMADAKLHKVPVLSPDINESKATFKVNKDGAIRFGLGGMKGFGGNVVSAIINEREENGLYSDVWDFVERVPVNRKAMEALISAGAFDSLGYKRTQFFTPGASGELFIDELCRYSDLYKIDKQDNSASLFGDVEELKPVRPVMPAAPIYEDQLAILQREKEIVGMYLSSHPLDRYAFTLKTFTNCEMAALTAREQKCTETQKGETVNLGGMVVEINEGVSRTGKPFCKVKVEDYSGQYEFAFFGKDYDAFKPKMSLHEAVYITGEIKPRFFAKDKDNKPVKQEFEMRVKDICSLGTVSDSLLKVFKVHINGNLITPELRKSLVSLLRKHKGKTPLSIMLFDPKNKWNVELSSKKYSVEVSQEFIDGLTYLGLQYSIEA